ncbi:MAG TPA: alcohol dehydrogenase catalytic domain-containing protein [Natronosporangium sp.]
MRAVVLVGPGRVEVTEDWPEPVAGPGDVVVRMRAVGLCGSDFAVYHGRREVPRLPWLIGHEGGGEIVAVGSAVTDRRVGQPVAIEPNYCCFDCPQCWAGNSSGCARRTMVGFNHPGLLAERVAVPARFTWPVPADWPDQTLACVEPAAVARTAVRRSGIGPGDRCLVVGAGSQGLFLCQALRAVGAVPAVVEPHPGRLALARRVGGWPADDPAERFRFVFEAAGVPDAVRTALDRADTGGTVVLLGLGPAPLPVTAAQLVRRQLTVRGSLIYDHPADFPDTIAALARWEFDPSQVVQPGFPPDRVAEAFAEALNLPGKPWLDLSPWSVD